MHVTVEVADETLPMAHLAQARKALDWQDVEPDLYADADLVERAG